MPLVTVLDHHGNVCLAQLAEFICFSKDRFLSAFQNTATVSENLFNGL